MRKGVSMHRLNTPPAKMASIVIHEFKPVKRKVDLISNEKESRFGFNALNRAWKRKGPRHSLGRGTA